MKIAIVGLPDFPLGKKTLDDDRLDRLSEIIKPLKTTSIVVEVLDASVLKDADGIICEKESKLDLIIADLEVVENRLLMVKDDAESKLFIRVKEALEKNMCLCEENFNEEEKKILLSSNLVSIKPVHFVDKNELKSVQQIIFDAYYISGAICFFTGTKAKEVRAWPIKKGTIALEAAGLIHSDMKRGFIKAEVIRYDDLMKAGNLMLAKHAMHLENKEYVVRDADYINFRFNV